MDVISMDDATQKVPSRPGMHSLLGIGGIHVREESLQELESQIQAICTESGFPANEILERSPGRELWMRQNLLDSQRQRFVIRILDLARELGATAYVVIEDSYHDRAITGAQSAEADLIHLFLERAHPRLTARQTHGIVIVS
jgi:hypothetical protein